MLDGVIIGDAIVLVVLKVGSYDVCIGEGISSAVIDIAPTKWEIYKNIFNILVDVTSMGYIQIMQLLWTIWPPI